MRMCLGASFIRAISNSRPSVMRIHTTYAIVALASVFGAGCSGSGTDPEWTSMTVVGHVTRSNTAPVANADVIVFSRRGGCDSPEWSQARARTGDDGRFQVSVPVGTVAFDGCIEVRATGLVDGVTRSATTAKPNVQWQQSAPSVVPLDVTLPN